MRSFALVFAQKKFKGRVRTFHAARSVQERSKLVHHVDAAHAAVGLHERGIHFLHAGPTAILQTFKTSSRKVAVFGCHLHQVRERPESDQVQILYGVRLSEAAEQRTNKLIRNADTAKFLIRVIIAFLVRVQKHIAHRQSIARRLMMVHDHDRHAQLLGVCDFHVRGNACIHGNQIAGAGSVHFIDGSHRKPVAVAKAVRQSPFRFDAHHFEAARQKCDRGHTVQVVVAKNEHAFAAFADRENPFHSLVHAHHEERVVHIAFAGAQHVVRIGHRLDSTRNEEPRHRMRNL